MNSKDSSASGPDPSGELNKESEDGPSSSSQAEQTSLRVPLLDRMVGFFRSKQGTTTLRENLTDALQEGAPDEVFSEGERAMLNNILRLREVRVEDVMVPRVDIEAVDVSTTLGDLLQAFQKSGHSRMPAYSGSLDDPLGMVHIRDVLDHITKAALKLGGGESLKATDLGGVDLTLTIGELELVRTVLFVPSSMHAADLMTRMQAARIQMALVIDEYGGTDGLVSLEDIVEVIVGDIEDEHDDEENPVQKTGENTYMVNGMAELDDIAEFIAGFEPGEHGEDVDTISGLIFNALGRVPTRGEVVKVIPGFEFQILEADRRRVRKIRITTSEEGFSGFEAEIEQHKSNSIHAA